jgi:formylglycine-generating enzyme required for sulfatase activity
MERISYLDFDLKISAVGDGYTATVLISPGGQGQATFTLPFSPVELENLILRMTRMRNARRRDSPEMEAARNLGGGLFQAVFQGAVRDCLIKSQATITDQTGLRIKLRLQEAPGLADLPWEFLFDRDEGHFLAQSVYTPIVRYLEFGGIISPLKVALPLQILGIVANPTDYRPPLNAVDEQKRLERALADLIQTNLVKITWLEQATLDGLRRALRTGSYHIFHFIGHGGFDRRSERGVLVFTDEDGRSQDVDAERLGVLLRDHRSLRLAVLNACEGARATADDPFAGVATNLVRQGIPAVVAMQFEISDPSARAFAGEFYAALAQGFPVDAAQAEARKAVYCLPEDVEWGTPVLYLRSVDGVLFNVLTVPATVETSLGVKPIGTVEPSVPVEETGPRIAVSSEQIVDTPLEPKTISVDPEKVLPSDLYTFVYLPECKGWIGRYPVTNFQYQRFLEAGDYASKDYWMNFPKYGSPPDYAPPGNMGDEGWQWLQKALKDKELSRDGKRIEPRRWREGDFGIQRPGAPVVKVTWYEANAYCKWLNANWNKQPESRDNEGFTPREIRLPTEKEWIAAAGGANPQRRFPWDLEGQATEKVEEIVRRANVSESKIGRTTPVGAYPLGQSPFGVWDLAGNVWEWQANLYGKDGSFFALRGGSFSYRAEFARLSYRYNSHLPSRWSFGGFRVFVSPS